jgi:CheY-like chemotaxis protein
MAEGGRLVIAARNLDPGYDSLPEELRESGRDFLLLSLVDDGCGMSDEVLEHALEPFYTTKAAAMGSGLGLSMVYGFVKQSGGHLEIESVEGEGTKVHCYLPRPLAGYRLKTQETTVPLTTPAGQGETILVVEDDPDVRALTSKLLEMLGYRVIVAATVPAAIEVLQGDAGVDLVMSDIVLSGGRSGLEVGRAALAHAGRPALLFMSGYAEDELEKGDKLMREVEMLNKPFRIEELARKVRQALDDKDVRAREPVSVSPAQGG